MYKIERRKLDSNVWQEYKRGFNDLSGVELFIHVESRHNNNYRDYEYRFTEYDSLLAIVLISIGSLCFIIVIALLIYALFQVGGITLT